MTGKNPAIYILLIFLIGFAVYANSIPNRFVWDDNWLVVNNPDIQSATIQNIKTILTHDLAHFMEKSNFYRPLQALSYMLDNRLWGKTPEVFRAVNIAIHALNGALLFILLYILVKDRLTSFFSALFFLVHPLQTSAVAYIAGRSDLLALMFLLISSIFFIRSRDSGGLLNGIVSVAAFILALLSKEVCIVFPLFLCLHVFLFKEERKDPPVKTKALLFFFLSVAVIYVILRLTVLKFAPLSAQAGNIPSLYRRALALLPVIATYLRLIILPYDLRMDRDFAMPHSLSDPRIIISAVILAIILYALGRSAKRDKKILLGAGWFFLFLAPCLNIIIPVNAPLSEHWLYIPFPGVSIILACFIPLIHHRSFKIQKIFYGAVAVTLAVYAGIAVNMNRHWKDEETLFSYIAGHEAVNPRSYYALGLRYLKTEQYSDAIFEFKKAIKARPDYFEPALYTAVAYANLKDFDSASFYFRKAADLKPDSGEGYIIYAQALNGAGNYDKAIEIFRAAINIKSENPVAYNGLGIAYANKRFYEKAEDAWTKALKLAPDSDEIRGNLEKVSKMIEQQHIEKGNRHASKGEYMSAIEEFKKALAENDRNISTLNNLGVLYGLMGENEKAVAKFNRVLELDPAESGAYKNIGIIYSKYPEKRKEAAGYLRKYLELSPLARDREKIMETIKELEGAGAPAGGPSED